MRQKEYQRKYFQEHKEENRLKSKLWFQKNKEKGRAINAKSRLKVRLLVLDKYSDGNPKCACCGEIEIKFLCIDHIHDNGAEERKRLKKGGGVEFYYYLKKSNFPKGYQVLCYNCNMSKSHYGKCPHKN